MLETIEDLVDEQQKVPAVTVISYFLQMFVSFLQMPCLLPFICLFASLLWMLICFHQVLFCFSWSTVQTMYITGSTTFSQIWLIPLFHCDFYIGYRLKSLCNSIICKSGAIFGYFLFKLRWISTSHTAIRVITKIPTPNILRPYICRPYIILIWRKCQGLGIGASICRISKPLVVEYTCNTIWEWIDYDDGFIFWVLYMLVACYICIFYASSNKIILQALWHVLVTNLWVAWLTIVTILYIKYIINDE